MAQQPPSSRECEVVHLFYPSARRNWHSHSLSGPGERTPDRLWPALHARPRLHRSGGDRTLADFFSVAIDANGAAHIVINDLTNQHHGAALFELTQVAGPSAIGTTLTQSTSNTATGVTDPAGDAQVPHYSPAGVGPNQPALDL